MIKVAFTPEYVPCYSIISVLWQWAFHLAEQRKGSLPFTHTIEIMHFRQKTFIRVKKADNVLQEYGSGCLYRTGLGSLSPKAIIT